jgi:hypothetical protein
MYRFGLVRGSVGGLAVRLSDETGMRSVRTRMTEEQVVVVLVQRLVESGEEMTGMTWLDMQDDQDVL